MPVSINVKEENEGKSDIDDYPVEVKVVKVSSEEARPEQYGNKNVANGLFRQFDGDQDKSYKENLPVKKKKMERLKKKIVKSFIQNMLLVVMVLIVGLENN